MSSNKIAFSLSCLSVALLTCLNGFCGDGVDLCSGIVSNCDNIVDIVNGFNGDTRANTRGSNGGNGNNGGNGKKVYADYHGVRYTREHDGKLGRWEMYASTEKSSTGRKSLCYNADLIDGSGRHDIAAVSYPLVGMQSNLDEDYIEYQILSAKAAKIDGFFIEWGFFPHENDELLKAMQKVASKYDFEIGVNWCDGWLYYNWITKIYPEIDSREKKTEYMAKCYRYLADSVYSVPTAAKVGGRPVFYHFGPGATVDEYRSVLAMQHSEAEDAESVPLSKSSSTRSCVKAGNGTCNLVGLRRWADWGHLENDRYIPVTHSDELDSWIEIGEIPAPWIPARVRERDEQHPYWDNYAVEDDLIEFMKPFRDSVWMNPRESYVVKSGFAMPGMDNRGCAGWGRGHFFLIPRDGGKTYDEMWRFCMESRDSLDMMFIASWSDYTEGHEIEPTVENGYRELLTTLKYASQFKGEKCDSTGIELPLRLFQLRKKIRFLSDIVPADIVPADVVPAGDVCCNGVCATSRNSMSAEDRPASLFNLTGLDEAAAEIAAGRYDRAAKLLDDAERQAKLLSDKVSVRSVRVEVQESSSCAAAGGNATDAANPVNSNSVAGSGKVLGWSKNSDGMREIYLDDAVIKEIAGSARYTGTISFEYKDDGQEFLFVRSETDRQPSSLFNVVGKLRTDGSGEWKKAAIELYDRNIVYRNGKPAFRILGNVGIRNISIELNLFSSRACSCLQGSCL